jgi:hypothetical protein
VDCAGHLTSLGLYVAAEFEGDCRVEGMTSLGIWGWQASCGGPRGGGAGADCGRVTARGCSAGPS